MENLQKEIDKLKEEINLLERKIESNDKKLPIKAGIGDMFEIGGVEWKVVDIVGGQYLCLGNPLNKAMPFDKNSNNWNNSSLRHYLNGEFYEKIVDEVGRQNIVPFQRDLTSLDGLTEYNGFITDYVSLLTVDEYRNYRQQFIPNTENCQWWLISPHSTSYNYISKLVSVVMSNGIIDGDVCCISNYVRPFVYFSSKIFEDRDVGKIRFPFLFREKN